jgi:hypothetical protein
VVESSGKFCFSCCSSTDGWPTSAPFTRVINVSQFYESVSKFQS